MEIAPGMVRTEEFSLNRLGSAGEGRRRLPRGARTAGGRGHRRLHRVDGHPAAPREHRPAWSSGRSRRRPSTRSRERTRPTAPPAAGTPSATKSGSRSDRTAPNSRTGRGGGRPARSRADGGRLAVEGDAELSRCTGATIRSAKASSSAAVAPGSVVSARLCRDDVPTRPSRVPRPKPACSHEPGGAELDQPVAGRPARAAVDRARGRDDRVGEERCRRCGCRGRPGRAPCPCRGAAPSTASRTAASGARSPISTPSRRASSA